MSQYRRGARPWPPSGTGCRPQGPCAPHCRPACGPRPPRRPCYPPRPPLPPVWGGPCRPGARVPWLAWALLAAGAPGLAIGFLVGLLAAVIGTETAERMLRKAELPLIVRQLVTDKSVLRGLNRQREELERAIVRTLADPRSGFSARLCASISRTLGAQLEEMARGAEMSICA